MLNSGWTTFKPQVGRVTFSGKTADITPVTKVSEKKYVVQSTDLHTGWMSVTPEIDEGLAEEIMSELCKTNKQRLFRIQEV